MTQIPASRVSCFLQRGVNEKKNAIGTNQTVSRRFPFFLVFSFFKSITTEPARLGGRVSACPLT